MGKSAQIIDKLIWITTVALFASFLIFNLTSTSSKGVFVITLILFVLYCLKTRAKFTIYFEEFHWFVIIFAGFSLISAIWATNRSDSVTTGITIIEIFICISIVYLCYQDCTTIEPLLSAVMWGGFVIAIYFFFSYGGLNVALTSAASGTRNIVGFANINAIARIMALTVIIDIFFVKKNGFRIQSLLGILPVLVIVVCESRTALIELIVGIVVFIIFNQIGSGNTLGRVFKMLLILIVLFIGLSYLVRLSVFNGIFGRMEGAIALFTGNGAVDHSSLLRQEMIELGLNIFKQHPIGGVGIGNAHIYNRAVLGHDSYLHNNYVEMLASGGIIGFILWYSVYVFFSRRLWKLRHLEPKLTSICITIVLMYLVSDYAAVSYYYKDTYFMLMILFMHIRNSTNIQLNKILE